MQSIPLPDPDHPWPREHQASEIGQQATGKQGCKFARRCPYAMDICLEREPELFQISNQRVAACYLYRDAPPLTSRAVDEVFTTSERSPRPDSE